LGGAVGYFDKNDIFAFAPPESGKIAPAQIKNSSGHLIEGFTFKTGTITRKSEESSVGYGTFKNGGAVGIHFDYPSSLHSIQQKNQGTSLSVLRLYLKVQQREILSLFRLVINSAFINEQKTNFRWEITPVKNRN